MKAVLQPGVNPVWVWLPARSLAQLGWGSDPTQHSSHCVGTGFIPTLSQALLSPRNQVLPRLLLQPC